ncbi:MAG: hypothetical protein CMK74_03520 [Pseudomonadales bacterium]|nr:hypothetical protein [Pseudomonadales bacterium]|tara:strand:+ start:314 stop:949 length:636 start_codon:yes stop_codon:yes gene_type:complete
MTKKYEPQLKYFNLLGGAELRQSRLMVAFIVVIVVLVVVVFNLVRMNTALQVANVALQKERVMYGYPNGAGMFVSSKQIPDHHLTAFTTTFLDNYYNFTPESSFANADEALRLMSSRLRALQEANLKVVARQSAEQQITQVFARTSEIKIELDPSMGYIVSFTGKRHRSTLNAIFRTNVYSIKMLIKPVRPSAHFEWAVVVDDIQIQEIDG